MKSILIISKDKKKQEEYISKLIQEFAIDRFELTEIEKEESIGIEEVRIIQKNLFLAPQKGTVRAVIIKTNDNITLQAQNALLKTLEEPPSHTIIVVTASTKESLLPTILSRTTIVNLDSENPKDQQSDFTKDILFLEEITLGSIGKRMQLAYNISQSKEEALVFLENVIQGLREKLINDCISGRSNYSLQTHYLLILKSFHKTHTQLFTTNASPRLTLENLFLEL